MVLCGRRLNMLVKIITNSDRVYEFSLLSSPYEGLAEVIIDGHKDWGIDVSQAKVDTGAGDPSMVQSWLEASEKVLTYLQTEDIDLARRLSRNRNPGNALEEFVYS